MVVAISAARNHHHVLVANTTNADEANTQGGAVPDKAGDWSTSAMMPPKAHELAQDCSETALPHYSAVKASCTTATKNIGGPYPPGESHRSSKKW